MTMNRHALPALILTATIQSAAAAVAEPPGISAALRAPADEQAEFMLNARGVQIYVCKPSATDPYGYQWAFVAPEATLLEGEKIVGHHGAGPVWESVSDHSSAKGTVRERQDGGAGNIPWLLLVAKSSEGAGRFAGVTSVQRIATRGGAEPTTPCDASKSGQEARVNYTADYYFYKQKPAQVSSRPGSAY
jgi:Protein of unknown function (DUF3455)